MKNLLMMLAVAVLAFTFTGCNKDAEAEAVMKEFDALANDIVQRISESPDAAGVEAAQKALDTRKPVLKEKAKGLKSGYVSDDMKKKYDESVTASANKITDVVEKYAVQLASSPEATKKFEKLMKDFAGIFDEN